MIRYLNLTIAACCLAFVGCNQAALMKRFASSEDEANAKKYIELLQQRKFEQVERDLDSSLVDSNIQDTLERMAAMIPAEGPKSIKVVGAHAFSGPDISRTNITLEYEFSDRWLLADVTTQKKEGSFTVVGFHITPIADSLENLNKFTLIGKGKVQYFGLILAILAILFSLYALVLCVITKNVKSKWLWVIFILVGVGKLTVNWTTGEWGFQTLAFQIPCGTASAQLYGPWMVAVSLPLGAIVFLLRREGSGPNQASTPPPSAPSSFASTPSV